MYVYAEFKSLCHTHTSGMLFFNLTVSAKHVVVLCEYVSVVKIYIMSVCMCVSLTVYAGCVYCAAVVLHPSLDH